MEPFGFAFKLPGGKYIGKISKGSPADKLGILKVGDELISIDNEKVSQYKDIVKRITAADRFIHLTLQRAIANHPATLSMTGNKTRTS